MRVCFLSFLMISLISLGQAEAKFRYYPSGQIKAKEYFKNGKPDSTWRRYHASGQMRSRMKFQEGKAVGEWLQWDLNGDLINRMYFKDGRAHVGNWTIHYDNGSNWKKYDVIQFVCESSYTLNGLDFRDSSFLCLDKPTSFWYATINENYGFPHPFLSNGLEPREYIPQHEPMTEIVVDRFFVNDSIKFKLDTILILTEDQKRLIQMDSFFYDGWVTSNKIGRYSNRQFTLFSSNKIVQQVQIDSKSKLVSYWKEIRDSKYNFMIEVHFDDSYSKIYTPTVNPKPDRPLLFEPIFGSGNKFHLDSIRHTYYRSGQLKSIYRHDSQNLKTGKWTEWYSNGQIKEVRFYELGEPVGIWKQYNSRGKLRGKLFFEECRVKKGYWVFISHGKKKTYHAELYVKNFEGVFWPNGKMKKPEKKSDEPVILLHEEHNFWDRYPH